MDYEDLCLEDAIDAVERALEFLECDFSAESRDERFAANDCIRHLREADAILAMLQNNRHESAF